MSSIVHFFEQIDFFLLCDHLGTFAFAVSGIRLSASKGFDWFGAFVVGMVTAVGGGTLRDILLDLPVFWLQDPSYLIVTGLSLVFTLLLRNYIVRANPTLFFFDSLGLGLFVVVGLAKSFEAGYPWWVGLVMGTITGSFGGMTRDILLNEVPLIFRKDLYASACLFGGIIYVLCIEFTQLPLQLTQFFSALAVVALRFASLIFGLGLPHFTSTEENEH